VNRLDLKLARTEDQQEWRLPAAPAVANFGVRSVRSQATSLTRRSAIALLRGARKLLLALFRRDQAIIPMIHGGRSVQRCSTSVQAS
jgi:hypothetical protein